MSEGESRKLVAIFGDLAAQFIHSSLQRIFDKVGERDFVAAFDLFDSFIAVNPPPVRKYVEEKIGEAETEAEAARDRVLRYYSDDVRRGVYSQHRVNALAENEYYRVKLRTGLRALGDAYYNYNTLFRKYTVANL